MVFCGSYVNLFYFVSPIFEEMNPNTKALMIKISTLYKIEEVENQTPRVNKATIAVQIQIANPDAVVDGGLVSNIGDEDCSRESDAILLLSTSAP